MVLIETGAIVHMSHQRFVLLGSRVHNVPLNNPIPTRKEGGRRLRERARVKPPLVSIITVVFRAGKDLPPLLESVIALRGDDIELIVIDGGSDDGTINVLREFDQAIDYWISEPDRGIYDAMNKGIAAATGKFVLHINAGDRLRCIPRRELEQSLADKIDVACFAVQMEDFGIHRPRTGFILRFANAWHHQGTFYQRESHLGYDTQYRIYGDFDLNQRMAKAGKTVRLSNTVVAEQVSVGASGDMTTYREQYNVVKKNFGTPYVCLAHIWRYIWPLFPRLKRWAEK
jgi:glycosyltransferase involved in cell wall biosynthesis